MDLAAIEEQESERDGFLRGNEMDPVRSREKREIDRHEVFSFNDSSKDKFSNKEQKKRKNSQVNGCKEENN